MKLLLIVFIIQTYHFFCNGANPQSIRDTIEKTFGYDCEVSPWIGEILFWKISADISRTHGWDIFTNPTQFKLQKFVRGVTQFQSDETYLILTKVELFYIYMFYWVGSLASLDDKKETAKYTIQHHLLLKNYYELKFGGRLVSISREREAIESELFQYIIFLPKENTTQQVINYYLLSRTMLTYPNMYVVRGEDTTRIKNVPIGTLWLKNDTCMILESSYNMDNCLKVYHYCGVTASVNTCNRARRFASLLQKQYRTYIGMRSHITIDRKDPPKFKSFVELLEDRSYYWPNKVDNSNDHIKDVETFIKERDKGISYSRISSDTAPIFKNSPHVILEGSLLKEDIIERPLSSVNIGFKYANHILNTDSISGVIVRFGSSILKELVITMQYVEEYVHKIESNGSIPTPVHIGGIIISNNITTVNLKINFIDYP